MLWGCVSSVDSVIGRRKRNTFSLHVPHLFFSLITQKNSFCTTHGPEFTISSELAPSLVKRVVTVESDSSVSTRFYAAKCKCRSQFCSDCSLAHCVSWREKLRPVLRDWYGVSMLTLTVDPSKFTDPESAYREVQRKRSVAEMVRRLEREDWVRSRKFCYALEFHKPENGGWPHYHVLVESRFVPHGELKKSWKHGHVWVTATRGKMSSDHAVNYATKYVAKAPEGFPDWVLDFKGNLRRFSVSRGLVESRKSKKKLVTKEGGFG